MGNCVALNFACDGAVNGIVRCLRGKGYIRDLKKNLRALERETEDLKAIQLQVQNKVARDNEARDRQTLEIVQVWLTRVEGIDTKFNDLLSESHVHLQKLCFFGQCSRNGISSYKYGKSVSLLLEEVKQLKSEGNFEEVSGPAPRSVVEERPTQPTIGQETMLATAWNRLLEDGVGIMGLHGMGGVGKTTLFKKIHNRIAEMDGRFDVVIWVVVSKGVEISKLRDDIAKSLNLFSERWTNKNESDKAAEMYTYLKKKRFVLMLDDIWEKVDLEVIGVPFPTRENGCKVAFTTRYRDVCGRMEDHEPMEVKCLEPNESWELFKKKVGENTLRDPDIVERARKVVEKCGGLPLALSVIGETMSSKTNVKEWQGALDDLTRSAAEFPDMKDKILPILKFSYDNLVNENTKSCFLYCALFPEDHKINKASLIDYWICEKFIREYQDLKTAKNKGYEILGSLIRANLLIEVNTYSVVMHDVVREMALWIASAFGKEEETFVVKARIGLREIPIVKDGGAVRRMSLMDNKIEEITPGSKFPQLITLFLQHNRLKHLSDEFIKSMQKLVVLDLSKNMEFRKLPEEISNLASLEYLNLSYTLIDQLPVGFQKLKRLNHLNVEFTGLHSISGISKLSSLRILKLMYSKAHGDVSLVKELQLMATLQSLTITISTQLGLEMILGDQRLASCIESLDIFEFEQIPFDISLLVGMDNLSELFMQSCHVLDLVDLHKSTFPSFTNLSNVIVTNCNSIKDLTWLLFVPNLVFLLVAEASEVEEIIKKEKTTDFTGITPFQKLEYMFLARVPKLESIYWSPLPFPLLTNMTLEDCPKLRKLPFDATSIQRINEFLLQASEKHVTDFEWEDEDTKIRFLPTFRPGTLDWNLLLQN